MNLEGRLAMDFSSNMSSSSPLTCDSGGDEVNDVMKSSIIKPWPPYTEFNVATLDYDILFRCVGAISALYAIFWVS